MDNDARKGFAKNMRTFHNKVKNQLIDASVKLTNGTHLLDIGCGRGGDLFKWDSANLDYVFGYDPNPSYIEEAKRRFNTSHLKRNYVFSTDLFESFENYFDIISCQFAIHYMFENVYTLDQHLSYVSRMLKPNGLYIGTFMDGDRVIEKIGRSNCYSNQAMCVRIPRVSDLERQKDAGTPLCVHLAGTLYFGEQSVSHEFLVKKEVLTRKCLEHGLRLVKYTPFRDYNNRMNFRMGPDYTECSYLYSSFVFKKHLKKKQ